MEESVSIVDEGDGGRNAVIFTKMDKEAFDFFPGIIGDSYAMLMTGDEILYVYCIF